MTFRSRHISVSIGRKANEVYEFASNPRNLPRWASGLSGSIRNVEGQWIAESPMGTVRIKFAAGNAFGVLDHDVTLESGDTFHNPMRVFPNGDGSELVFTLYMRPGTPEQAFEQDAEQVARDMERLKALLEGSRVQAV